MKATLKSDDVEEWLDLKIVRPLGYWWTLFFYKLGVHPNTVTVLSMIIGDEKETSKIIKEAKKRGVEFLLPDINKSTEVFTIEEEGIRFPLSNIKNIGINTCVTNVYFLHKETRLFIFCFRKNIL